MRIYSEIRAIIISRALLCHRFFGVVAARSASNLSVPLAAALISRFILKTFPHLNSHSSQGHFSREHQNDPVSMTNIQCCSKSNFLCDNTNAFSLFFGLYWMKQQTLMLCSNPVPQQIAFFPLLSKKRLVQLFIAPVSSSSNQPPEFFMFFNRKPQIASSSQSELVFADVTLANLVINIYQMSVRSTDNV